MTIDEFKARTGYSPSPKEWREIVRGYLSNDDSKDLFCNRWLRLNPDRYRRVVSEGLYSRFIPW